jgi:shikimate 5-dehydrogenase
VPCEYHHCPAFEDNDRVLHNMPAGSLVVNATGLGKDRPGSPITDRARFPRNALAWDFNYRGDLRFLAQARAQQQERDLIVEDGWTYFVHGWTQVIAEVFHIDITPPTFSQLSRLAAEAR